MWLRGDDINDTNAKLANKKLDDIYHELRNPESELANRTRQLRALSNTSPMKAKNMEVSLPFIITCRLTTFSLSSGELSYTEYFCVDVHSHPKEEEEFANWRKEIEKDRYVTMTFLSAARTTFHIFFHLRQPCKNRKAFSRFYRVFVIRFFKEHNIKEEIDNTTSSPVRPIPLAYDAEAFYRIGGALVAIEEFEGGEENNILYEREEKHREHAASKKKEEEKEGQKEADPNTREISVIKDILNRGIGQTKRRAEATIKEKRERFKANEDFLSALLAKEGARIEEKTLKGAVLKLKIEKEGVRIMYNIVFGEKTFSVSSMSSVAANKNIVVIKEALQQFVKDYVYNIH